MRKAIIISVAFHAFILGLAFFVMRAPAAFKVPEPTPITVDITNIGEKVQQMAKANSDAPPLKKETPDIQPKPAPPAPKVDTKINTAAHETVPPPPPPAPVKTPPKPKADPVPPEPKEAVEDPVPPEPKEPPADTKALSQLLQDQQDEADAEAKRKLEVQKKAEAKKKAEEKKAAEAQQAAEEKLAAEQKKAEDKKKLDKAMAQAQLLLNKKLGEATAPAPASTTKGTPQPAAKPASGDSASDTATLVSALVTKVKGCFTIPPSAREKNVSVPIHFILNRDGSVQGQPEPTADSSDPVVQATTRAAISAIMECQPYDLPPDQYKDWQDNELDFNPTHLSG